MTKKMSSVETIIEQVVMGTYKNGEDKILYKTLPQSMIEHARQMHKEEIEASYADGYAQGYKLALELVQCSISNLIPNNDESNN